jgi:hypothetical protein
VHESERCNRLPLKWLLSEVERHQSLVKTLGSEFESLPPTDRTPSGASTYGRETLNRLQDFIHRADSMSERESARSDRESASALQTRAGFETPAPTHVRRCHNPNDRASYWLMTTHK